jgi:hypothetical protein
MRVCTTLSPGGFPTLLRSEIVRARSLLQCRPTSNKPKRIHHNTEGIRTLRHHVFSFLHYYSSIRSYNLFKHCH